MGIAVRETHTAYVVMVDDVVYKAKKRIRTAFLDFSTADKRRSACEREVELNRRLCPDVYLGVAELADPTGGPAEPLVKMRRMPDNRRLATIVVRGDDSPAQLDEIADVIARFHERAVRGRDIDDDATRDAVAARWRANVTEARGYQPRALAEVEVDEIDRRARQYLVGREPVFTERIECGRIVDGHADLLADDIFCLPDGPRILDCLDFDDHLRHIDGLDDAACLAMDLEYLGRAELAGAFVRRYCACAADDPPPTLIDHYVAYRAFMRAKVTCLRYTQGSTEALVDARGHTQLALRHLRSGAVRLALIGGLPGTGKSTLSRAVAERVGATVLSSDRVRKELAGVGPHVSCANEYGHGLYSGTMTEDTYTEMLRRAAQLLSRGCSVVLDASWTDPRLRQWATSTTRTAHSDLVEIECVAPRSVAVERIRTRPHGNSDATTEIYDAMAQRVTHPPSATPIDTTTDLGDAVDAVRALWDATEGWRNY
jgi:uncharacterized protein